MAKSYVRDTSGLKRYQETLRQAKQIGGAYQEYVKAYYKRSKSLRKAGVKIKETGARVLTYEEYQTNITSERVNTGKLISEQFGTLTGNQAKALQAALKEKGFEISLQRASVRQLSKSEWNAIKLEYQNLKAKGLTGAAAKDELAQNFFGS